MPEHNDEFDAFLTQTLKQHQEPSRPEFVRKFQAELEAQEILETLKRQQRRGRMVDVGVGLAALALLALCPRVLTYPATIVAERLGTTTQAFLSFDNLSLIVVIFALTIAGAVFLADWLEPTTTDPL
ncbi:MAG: hypothetical protein FWC56_00160 [Phycisphaerae bacterium]|nr:hypothetical protein [Phycisphaerae bacterium]